MRCHNPGYCDESTDCYGCDFLESQEICVKEKTDWASMKVGLFSDRGTDVSKAIEFAHAIIESDGGQSKAAFYTGLHVVIRRYEYLR